MRSFFASRKAAAVADGENPFLAAAATASAKESGGERSPHGLSDGVSQLTLSAPSEDGSDARSNATRAVEDIDEENAVLRQQLAKVADQMSNLEEDFERRLKALKDQFAKEMEELKRTHEEDEQDWQEEVDELQEQLATSQSEVYRLSERSAHLTDDVDSLKSQVARAKKEAEDVRLRMQADAEVLQGQLADSTRQRVTTLQSLQNEREHLEALKIKYLAAVSNISDLREENNRLARALEALRSGAGPVPVLSLRITPDPTPDGSPGRAHGHSPDPAPFSPTSTVSSEHSHFGHHALVPAHAPSPLHAGMHAPSPVPSGTPSPGPPTPTRDLHRSFSLRHARRAPLADLPAGPGGALGLTLDHPALSGAAAAKLLRKPSVSIPRRRGTPVAAAPAAGSAVDAGPGGAGGPDKGADAAADKGADAAVEKGADAAAEKGMDVVPL